MDFADWSYEEKLCYIAHNWADKEKETPHLQDFDYMDMAKASVEFIQSQPDNVDFLIHIENCFDVLARECEGADSPEWTKAYFAHYY